MVFSVPEGPGQLFRALSVFALRELDISKIESRPMRSKPMQPFIGAGRHNVSEASLLCGDQSEQNRRTNQSEQSPFVRMQRG